MNENVLNHEQIVAIKKCGKYLSQVLDIVVSNIKPGISTKSLDLIAKEELKKRGCTPSFLNYFIEGVGHYPASLCVSINDEIVHGLPTHQNIVKEGDIVSLDLGANFSGVCTDMAVTVIAGEKDEIEPKMSQLVEVTKEALIKGIKAAKIGNTIGDIGFAVEQYVLDHDLVVIKDYVGHGIGTKPHMWPQIPNYGKSGSGPKIIEGMALAIEPMVTLEDAATIVHSNNWTVKTANGLNAAHFEHTVVIENGKPVIVTRSKGIGE